MQTKKSKRTKKVFNLRSKKKNANTHVVVSGRMNERNSMKNVSEYESERERERVEEGD
jgi:hypothetical protein